MLNKKNKILILLAICLCGLITACSSNNREYIDPPKAVNGVLDLTDWNWQQYGIVPLDGQWEFYWQEILAPQDFIEANSIEKKNLITIPRAWNNHIVDGEKLSGNGYATYRLIIHHSSDQIFGIKIPRIFTSYIFWANGDLVASAGKLGISKHKMIPQYSPQVIYFKPELDTIELVVQVANFYHRSGGILESIKIGSASQISNTYIENLALELFIFGCLFIVGFYHVALFIFRSKDKSTLYFGIYCLLISARTLLVGEIFLIRLFPNFNWEIAHKIQTLAYYLGVPLVISFLKSVFPNDTSKKIDSFINFFASIFGLLVLLTPARVFTPFNPIYQVFSLAIFLYVLYIVAIICFKKRQGAYLIGLGLVILVICAVNDVLFLSVILADSNEIFLRNFITKGNLSSQGLLFFVFTQSMVLAKKFSQSFSNVELLTEQLQQSNDLLEEKVKVRTLALETSKKELEKAYEAISNSEKSLQSFMQNISHDLRTPLSAVKGYISAILDGIANNPAQQKKYLERTIDRVDNLSYMVQELIDLSQLQSKQLKLQFVEITVNQFILTLTKKYSLDMKNENMIFAVHQPHGKQDDTAQTESLFVMVDMQKLDRVFVNLLSNARKYTHEGGCIDLSFEIETEKKRLIVKISDTGIGISEEDLPYIFERFYVASKARKASTPSSGLGLAIVKEIVKSHNGEMWVESKANEGSHFYFTLPVYKKDG